MTSPVFFSKKTNASKKPKRYIKLYGMQSSRSARHSSFQFTLAKWALKSPVGDGLRNPWWYAFCYAHELTNEWLAGKTTMNESMYLLYDH